MVKIMKNRLDSFVDAYSKSFDYDLDNQIMLNWYPERIIGRTKAHNSVLELGLGHGYTCQRFESYFQDYSVIDGSEKVIAAYKSAYASTNANIYHDFFETFTSSSVYDVIIMGFILEHVDDPAFILDHYKKMLSPQGKCFIAVPNAASLHRRFGKEAGLLDELTTLGAGDLQLGHKRLYTTNSLSRLLEGAGFTITHTEGIFLKPMTTKQLCSLNLDEKIFRAMCQVGIDYPELCAALLFEVTLR